jgi:hypothetical protein
MSFFVNSFLYPLLVWGQTEPSGARQRLGYSAASASEGAASQPCLGTDVGNPARQLCSLASRRSAANSGCGEVTVMVAFHIFSTVGIYLDLFYLGSAWASMARPWPWLERHNMHNNLAVQGVVAKIGS